MSLWSEVRHHYEDYEEPDPPVFERQDQHTARQFHHCEDCEGTIQPGERYNKYVWKDDEGFHILKTHADRGACGAMRLKVEAERARLEADCAKDWTALAQAQAGAGEGQGEGEGACICEGSGRVLIDDDAEVPCPHCSEGQGQGQGEGA